MSELRVPDRERPPASAARLRGAAIAPRKRLPLPTMPNAASPGNGGPPLAGLKAQPTRRNTVDELPLRSVRPFRQSFLAPAQASAMGRAQSAPEPAAERINGRVIGPAHAEAGVVVAPRSTAAPTAAPPQQPEVAPQPATAAVDISSVI